MNRFRKRVVALAAALGAAALAVALGPSAYAGTTGGTYTWYSFPAGTPGLHQMSWETTVQTDPGRSSHVYWAHQFEFTAPGTTAYTGMQTNGPGQTPLFLFSVWDATEAKVGSSGSWCQTFGGEGEGQSCRMNYDWTAGHTYRFTIADEGDQWFGATVTDVQTGTSFKLGSIRAAGATISPVNMVDWTEYYEWNWPNSTCNNQPYSQTKFGLPQGDGIAATISSTTTNGGCSPTTVSEAVAGGSLQTLGIGNSVRAQVTGPSARVMAGSGGPDADGYATSVSSDTTNANQFWVYAVDDTLELGYGGRCLFDDGSGSAPVRPCNGSAATHWTVSNGALVNAGTGRCLTSPTTFSTTLRMTTCSGASNQKWTPPARHS